MIKFLISRLRPLKFFIRFLRFVSKKADKLRPHRNLYLALVAIFTIIKTNWGRKRLKGFWFVRYLKTFILIFSYCNLVIDLILLIIYMQFDSSSWIPSIPAFMSLSEYLPDSRSDPKLFL